ncbi:MAG: DUF2130 domain-containing protein [Cyclobacteriaceae bacterium]
MQNYQISCPKCNHQFNAEDALNQQLTLKLNQQLEGRLKEIQTTYQEKEDKLRKFQYKLQQEQAQLDDKVKQMLQSKEAAFKQELKAKLLQENAEEMKAMQQKLEEKRQLLKQSRAKELEVEQLKSKLLEEKENAELELQKRLNNERQKLNQSIQERITQEFELKLKDKEHDLETYKKQVNELKRKMEQGSMQKQGEVQELAIQEYLCQLFPIDEIREVAKGVRGADVIHVVRNEAAKVIGSILYESKRTKAFNQEWVQKIKNDQIAAGANLAVIVTEALPEEQCKLTQIDGVWICDFPTFKWLSLVLRQELMSLSEVVTSQKNKGSKMEMLYGYLTGADFKNQIIAIVNSFESLIQMKTKERGMMERIWKERRKHLERIYIQTNNFYGSIKGITGNSLPDLTMPELPA